MGIISFQNRQLKLKTSFFKQMETTKWLFSNKTINAIEKQFFISREDRDKQSTPIVFQVKKAGATGSPVGSLFVTGTTRGFNKKFLRGTSRNYWSVLVKPEREKHFKFFFTIIQGSCLVD